LLFVGSQDLNKTSINYFEMTSVKSDVFFTEIYTFNDRYRLLWSAGEAPPEKAKGAIMLIDISCSMEEHMESLRMAVASILHDTNVPKKFHIPDADGPTAMVCAIEQILSRVGSEQATTVYLVGDGGENTHYGTLPIGLNAEQIIIESPYLDFRKYPLQDEATHYRALVDFLKFKRVTLVMLALGDSVKCFLGGLANTKDIYLGHLDFKEDIDNMMKIATLLKQQSRKGVVQTTLIQVDEADKKNGAQRKMTSQAQQKLELIIGNITVGNAPRAVQALVCSGAKQLEDTMTSVIDAYIAKPNAISCAKEFRKHVNAHLLFFMIKCVENTVAPAVIIGGKKNRLVVYPDNCNDGTYSTCLNQICSRLAGVGGVLKKEPDTPALGFTVQHNGVSYKFGAKCAQYSCVFELSAMQELAANAAFCVSQHELEAPPKAAKRQKV